MDVCNYIYSMHWLYPSSAPFSSGPLRYPSPIKWADHFASTWQDFITTNDQTLNDIKASPNLHYPSLVQFEMNQDKTNKK